MEKLNKNRFYLKNLERLKDVSFTRKELVNLMLRGTITAEFQVRKTPNDEWVTINRVPEIIELFKKINETKEKAPTFKYLKLSFLIFSFLIPYSLIYIFGFKGLIYSQNNFVLIQKKIKPSVDMKLANKSKASTKKVKKKIVEKDLTVYTDPLPIFYPVFNHYKKFRNCPLSSQGKFSGKSYGKNIVGHIKSFTKRGKGALFLKRQDFHEEILLGNPGNFYISLDQVDRGLFGLLEVKKKKKVIGLSLLASLCTHKWSKLPVETLGWWDLVNDNGKAKRVLKVFKDILPDKTKSKLSKLVGVKSKPNSEKRENTQMEINEILESVLEEKLFKRHFIHRQKRQGYVYDFRSLKFESISTQSSKEEDSFFKLVSKKSCKIGALGRMKKSPYFKVTLGAFEKETPWGDKISVGEQSFKIRFGRADNQKSAIKLKKLVFENCYEGSIQAKSPKVMSK